MNRLKGKRKKHGMLTHGCIHIRTRNIARDRERHYIVIKELIHQEDTTTLSETAHTVRTSEHTEQSPQS